MPDYYCLLLYCYAPPLTSNHHPYHLKGLKIKRSYLITPLQFARNYPYHRGMLLLQTFFSVVPCSSAVGWAVINYCFTVGTNALLCNEFFLYSIPQALLCDEIYVTKVAQLKSRKLASRKAVIKLSALYFKSR